MKKLFGIFLFLVLFFLHHKTPLAAEKNQFVTIVNPVRKSTYTKSLSENLKVQYQVVSQFSLPATWLLTYDVLTDEDALRVIKGFDKYQEIGIFLEVGPRLAKDSDVSYNDTGSWHHATSVFLSGYTQVERIKMIDILFDRFKEVFGYYPKSVGSWWTDSFSLSYMREKYGITANLGVSDQFSTDGYQVWGQYWSIPFYPSKHHAGIPARTIDNKLDVVMFQWAARDPLNGYFSSLFSSQDYRQDPVGQDLRYFEKLLKLFVNKGFNKFGQISVGLEADLSPEAYRTDFRDQMELVKRLENEGLLKTSTMRDFASWYRQSFPGISPPHLIETDDLLGKPLKVIWYQSPAYRVGIVYDYGKQIIKIFDLRTYHTDFQEPYFILPNKQFTLSIYIPSYFDEVNYSNDVWQINLGPLKRFKEENGSFNFIFQDGQVILSKEAISILDDNLILPEVLTKSKSLEIKRVSGGYKIIPKEEWVVGEGGYIFRDLTDVATHKLTRKINIALVFIGTLLFLGLSFRVICLRIEEKRKLVFLSLVIISFLSYPMVWYQKNTTDYYVSQAEVDALFRLSLLPEGSVLVYDRECLGCDWHTPVKPAFFANKRNYVERVGKHPIVYNKSVFEARSQNQAREEFEKTGALYIYVVEYEKYLERPPFSPGDLDIEKVYGNANARIWRVKR